MGEKMTVLKIQVGSVFIDGKSHGVFIDAWEKKTKDGKKYFVTQMPIWVQQVEKKSTNKTTQDVL